MKKTKNFKMCAVAALVAGTLIVGVPVMANATEWKQDPTGAWMLVDDSGLSLKGWQTMDGETYYLDDMGKMVTGQQDIGGYTYYFDESGKMMRDWWLKDGYSHFGTAWYYFQPDGTMAHGWTMASDGKVYYFDSPEYPGAVWTISGSAMPIHGMGPSLDGIASMDFHYVYGDVTEVHPSDMTCSESEFWWTLKSKLGVSDEIASKLVSLVPGKWYQQADRCAATLWQQGYDRNSAYNAMIARGFTEDQATWACCMKWPTVNEQGLWKNEKGEYVSCEELTDSHRYDVNENIDVEYQHDTSTDIRYQNGPYTYTMTGVNAYRENSNVPVAPNLTIEDYNYFEDVEKPGENPGNAWKGDVPPSEIPDDPNAPIVPVTFNEDGSILGSPADWYETHPGQEPEALGQDEYYTPGPMEAYATAHNISVEELAAQANGTAYAGVAPIPSTAGVN